ncbi:MAG: RsmE family RNA methyltransferase [Actinomycetota bacterium]
MAEPWFVAPPEAWVEREIHLPPEESHHALKVLRVSPPDIITVADGQGTVARCSAARVDDGGLVAEIVESERVPRLRPEIVVYQGAAKGTKVDGVIERLAELGAAEACVFSSARAVVRWDDHKLERLSERWRTIARSAAKQSRSPFVMNAGGGLSFAELLRRVGKEQLATVLWEEASLPLRTAFVGEAERVALIVGPEGGLDRSEAEALADAGAQLVSLGPRILRTENAAVVAASAVLYHFGLIG